MTDKELRIKALEAAVQVCFRTSDLRDTAEEIYQWLKGNDV